MRNRFFIDKEIFSMADILSIVSMKRPGYAFNLALSMYDRLPEDSNDLISMLDVQAEELVGRYLGFVNRFGIKSFEKLDFEGHEIMIADRRGFGEFYIPAFEMSRKINKGNYILFKGDTISIRINDRKLLTRLHGAIEDYCVSFGGRAGEYGAKLKGDISYQKFKSIVSSSKTI